MPALFVSHSSRDDAQVNSLKSWLRNNGFTDLFIDHRNIVGGDKWPQALRDSAGACRVVVCLVTNNWLASNECFAEYHAAWYMGKRIIPLFVVQTAEGALADRLAKLRAEDQGIDITSCIAPDGSLDVSRDPAAQERLKHGLLAAGALARIGLDPEAFAIDQKRRPDPFPGLASFGDEDADAALFYGRSHDIAETLQDLRKMRAGAERRPLVIVGVSGAGKSSLLKAGLLPRLRRETPAWLPLRTFRPGAEPLLNFAEAITRTLDEFGVSEAPGTVRDRLFDAWKAANTHSNDQRTIKPLDRMLAALEHEGQALRTAAARPGSSIVIPIDQAEELIRSEGPSSEAMADYLRAALLAPTLWQLVFTIRSDSLTEFQKHPRFQNLNADFYDLRTLPTFNFDAVVEAPARRYNVEIEPALVVELMRDAEKEEDALPLLAFALQRLWQQYSKTKKLTKLNYENVGRLGGLIEDAAERALRGLEADTPIPASEPSRRLEKLGAETFVPALAQINEQGLIVRRAADWPAFGEDARELLERFSRRRLVVQRGVDPNQSTVEVTHEALFRKWRRLESWILPEKERLEILRMVESAAHDWKKRTSRQWLVHRGSRLKAARLLSTSPRYQPRFNATDLEYLNACNRAAIRRKVALGTILSALLLLTIGAAWRIETNEATDSFLKEANSLNLLYAHKPGRNTLSAASRNALAALSQTGSPRAADCRSTNELRFGHETLSAAECQLRRAGQIEPMTEGAGRHLTFSSQKIEFSNGTTRRDVSKLKSMLVNAVSVDLSADLSRLFLQYADGSARLFDLENDRLVLDLSPRRNEGSNISTPRFIGLEDGRFLAPDREARKRLALTVMAWRHNRLVGIDSDGRLNLWNSSNGSRIAELMPPAFLSQLRYVGLIKNDSLVFLIGSDGAHLFRSDNGIKVNDIAASVTPQFASSWALISKQFLQSIKGEIEDEEDGEAAFDISDDGSRYLIRHNSSTAVLTTSDNELIALVGGFQGHSPRRFVEGKREKVGWSGDKRLIWELSESGRLRGAELRTWVCKQSHRTFSSVFESGERESNAYLKGRPADVCAWSGLNSLRGWYQVYTRWKFLLTGLDVEESSDVHAE